MNDIAQMLEHPEAGTARNRRVMNIGFIGLGQMGGRHGG